MKNTKTLNDIEMQVMDAIIAGNNTAPKIIAHTDMVGSTVYRCLNSRRGELWKDRKGPGGVRHWRVIKAEDQTPEPDTEAVHVPETKAAPDRAQRRVEMTDMAADILAIDKIVGQRPRPADFLRWLADVYDKKETM